MNILTSKIKFYFHLTVTTLMTIVLLSCNIESKKTKQISISSNNDSLAKALFEQKCNVCHDGMNKTEKQIIAPPFYAVRMVYMKAAMDKNDFIETMKDFTHNPDSTKSLMKPAIKRFGVMPYQKFDEKEVDLIIDYIYRTQQPKPEWFDKHQELHRRGIAH